MKRCGAWILLGVLALPTARAQESGEAAGDEGARGTGTDAGVETLTLRVTNVRGGSVVVVDRGAADGLREGDRVTLRPLDSRPRQGRVIGLEDRSATVRLEGAISAVPVGVRGLARVPAERFAPPADVEPVPDLPPAGDAPEHPPWRNDDEEFEEGMPLLKSIDGVRPEQRPPIVSGRVYSAGDYRASTDDERSDHFVRLGGELHWENPLGRGGQFYFEGEGNHRGTEVQGQVDESFGKGRIDRLSYAIGGTRFRPSRHEFGRFLHDGVPELGIVDGYEWNRRLDGGSRVGASAGYLPEPTPSMSTFEDFEVSGFWQWAADERERLTATTAYQKTWHDGAPDRDLFLLKLDYWENEGWDFHGTGWVDWYTDSDAGKGSGPEVTRVFASTSRTWLSGDGMTVSYTRDRLPSLKRDELQFFADADLLGDSRDDRVSVDGWHWVNRERRLFARTGVWTDQEEWGGDLEVGVEQLGWFQDGSRAELSLFGSQGRFSSLLGMRTSYGVQLALTHWSVSYEYFQSNQEGFSDDNDDLDHHRLLGNLDWTHLAGWSVSLRGGLERWSDEFAGVAGFYVQRSF